MHEVINICDLIHEASYCVGSMHTYKTRRLMIKFEKDLQEILTRRTPMSAETYSTSQWILK